MFILEGVLVELDIVEQSFIHPPSPETDSSLCELLDSLISSYLQALSQPLVPSSFKSPSSRPVPSSPKSPLS